MSEQHRTVLITGALAGIGRATAVAFARAGANVVVSGRRPDAGEALAAELRGHGGAVEFIAADVRRECEIRQLVDETVARFGRVDVAVNNAGVDGEMVAFAEVTPESYAATFDTNVLGTLLGIKHELRVMETQGSGSIVNLSSIYGQKGFPLNAPYVASKHAIIGLTKSAALEAAPYGVRVNAVAPGPVQTAMLDRVTGGDAEAKAAFLATVPEITPTAGHEPSDAADLRDAFSLGLPAAGVVDHDVFASIYNPGKLALLVSWTDADTAAAWMPAAGPDIAGLRHRAVRVIRDYGKFDRREAPQYYPDAPGQATIHALATPEPFESKG